MVEEKFDTTKEKVSDNISAAATKVHEKSDTIQDFLSSKTEDVEDYLREKTYEAGDITQQTIERANRAGHRAADVLEGSSDYIRTFDIVEAKNSAVNTLRKNPEIGIAFAGMFGLALGWLLGRRSR
ncbi:MAG: hypothetical protein KDB79_12945 [Acidobacteria bacterium]|nr:hypothetical protein [Acidobacteriota bacterium]